jgi:FkbM family methyltransferase
MTSGEKIIVDVGAHMGVFTIEFGKLYKIKNAILVEPIKELAEKMRFDFNDFPYHIYNNVLTENDFQAVEFRINEFEETSSIFEIKTNLEELSNISTRLLKCQSVTSRTLDSILIEQMIEYVDLIKIDVQGAEHLVLMGGKEVLKNVRLVWVELSFKPLYFGSSVFSDVYKILVDYGFILLEISPGHRAPSRELLQSDFLFGNPRFELSIS